MVFILNQPWPYLAVAALAGSIGWFVVTQPRRPGTRYFAWTVGIWFLWALAAGLQTVVRSPELRYWLWALQSLCSLLAAPLELFIVLEYTGNEKWLARRSLLLVFLPALIFIFIAFFLPDSIVSIEYYLGVPVFQGSRWLRLGFFIYVLILILITLGLLINCLLRAPAFWVPILLIALERIIPTVSYIYLFPRQIIVSPIQLTILIAGLSMLLYFAALYYYRLLRVIPIARDLVISRMPYSLIVLDAENRLADFNSAARGLPGLPGRLAFGQAGSQALGGWWEKLSLMIGNDPVSQDVPAKLESTALIFRVTGLPLLQASGWRMGQVFLIEDVTQARQAQRQQAQALWAQATLEERQQLANELHDGLTQSLAFLNMQSQAAQVYLRTGNHEATLSSLARLSEAANEIQDDTRALIGSLLSVSAPAENFCDTLRQLLVVFEGQTGLAVNLEIDHALGTDLNEICNPDSLPSSVAVELIRITQEALANVRKHAQGASRVSIQLSARDGQITFTIADDGSGFDQAEPRDDGKHFGLQVMQQRAARIGGQVVIDSAPGKGVRIEVRVPLSDQS